MRLRNLILLTVTALASLTVASCGGDDGGGETTVGESTVTTDTAGGDGAARRVVIEAQDGAFDARSIYEAASPGVVTVISVIDSPSSSDLFGGSGVAEGSGFVISEDGEILTNAHVVTDADTAGASAPIHEAREVYVKFADQNQVEAEIVGVDPFADVALLKVDPDGLDLQPLKLGSENDVQVGDPVAAIGSPFSQERSLSVGIVSATDRSIQGLTKFGIEGAIQTDASINPGNSGGPLLDAEGEVVGIDQQINSTSGGNEGVGFAVPIDLAERSVDQLRSDGEVAYAYIGVETAGLYPQLADRLGIEVDSGTLLTKVVPGGPADDAGLQGGGDPIRFQAQTVRAGGDVITAIDGERIDDPSDLPRIISLHEPGDEVSVDFLRDGEQMQAEITLGERPGS